MATPVSGMYTEPGTEIIVTYADDSQKVVPMTMDNRFYAKYVASGVVTAPYSEPVTSVSQAPKDEAGRRVQLVLKDAATQRNMTATAAKLVRHESLGTIGAQEQYVLDMLEAIQTWVENTLIKGRELAANEDPTYEDESHWTDPPNGWETIIAMM